ncbi:hypothetical protein ACTXT7_008368 [Hymenolepis weldensis]
MAVAPPPNPLNLIDKSLLKRRKRPIQTQRRVHYLLNGFHDKPTSMLTTTSSILEWLPVSKSIKQNASQAQYGKFRQH